MKVSCFPFTGAALAFNSIYRILREEESIIDQFWMELLYYLFKNLCLTSSYDIYSDNISEVISSIDHLERVFREKASLFNQVCITLYAYSKCTTQFFMLAGWLYLYKTSEESKTEIMQVDIKDIRYSLDIYQLILVIILKKNLEDVFITNYAFVYF